MTHGIGLGAMSAASDGSANVVLVGRLEELEGLASDHPCGLALEVLVGRLAVDLDGPGAGRDPDAGDGRLALAGCVDGELSP
jgi:hypothetical protein